MHLNTSPTSFEGSGTGEGEKKNKTLKNLQLAPKKQLGIGQKAIKVEEAKCRQK